MLPLSVGSSWRLSADGQEYTVEVDSTAEFNGKPVYLLINRAFASFAFEYYLSKDADGDYYHGSQATSSFGTVTILYVPPRLQLPDELDYGESELTSTTISVTNSTVGTVSGPYAIEDRITLVGPEVVQVPAGTFAAFRVEIESDFNPNPLLPDIPSSSTNWYVPGIGVVKAINVSDEGTETTVLLDYSLAGTDSDGDGLPDDYDPFPNDPDETADSDGDGTGNNADTDDDNDGLADVLELQCGLNSLLADADGDLDGDGFANVDECREGTDPREPSDPGQGLNLNLIQAALCKQNGDC